MSGAMPAGAPYVVSQRFDDLGLDGTPRRVGIFGGTFDPVHVGHICAAYAVHRAFDLDAVVFMPSGVPAFKQQTVVASPEDRFAMCDMAAHEYHYPYFDASNMETRREGVSYTIDTLRAVRAHYPENVEIVFILGVDALLSLLKWRAPDDLKSLASFIVLSRPGYELRDNLREQLREQGFHVTELDNVGVDVSSSEVRARLAKGLSVEGYIPRVVNSYIAEKGLYQGPAKEGL